MTQLTEMLQTHSYTNGPTYRFAVFASLQKALRWGACLWGSGLSASARSHSLLWKGTMLGRGKDITFYFKERKILERQNAYNN